MRLIDADSLIAQLEDIISDYTSNGTFPNGFDINAAIDRLEDAPTIDPETLPGVRQLRAELARVTTERDAAVSDLENIMAYNSDTCQSCKNNQCYVRGGTKPCLPKWRGPQKEE